MSSDSRGRGRHGRSTSSSLKASEGLDAAAAGDRRRETPISRAVRKQHGPPFREVTIELPFNEAGYLETTIVYPITQHEPSNPLVRSTNAIAILLHPWSRAGGNANDPVLLSFISLFLRRDYHVIVYNSRGVGNSGGSPSLSGLAEVHDLQVVVDLALREIDAVDEIVLLGYSYGSLAVSHHPVRPISLFSPASLARNPHVSPALKIRHVLISYPIGVLWLLTLFRTTSYTAKLHELVKSPGADVLVLYGERDQFTKKDKYRRWANDLRAAFGSAVPPLGTRTGAGAPEQLLPPTAAIDAAPPSSTATTTPSSIPLIPSNPSRTNGSTGSSVEELIPPPKLTLHVVPEADHFWRGSSSILREAHSVLESWLDGGGDGTSPAHPPSIERPTPSIFGEDGGDASTSTA